MQTYLDPAEARSEHIRVIRGRLFVVIKHEREQTATAPRMTRIETVPALVAWRRTDNATQFL